MNSAPVDAVAQSDTNKIQGTTESFWNPEAAGAWSLIFGPIFGSVLVLMNWQTLRNQGRVRNAQIWLIVSILVFVIGFFMSATLNRTVALVYLLIWYLSVAKPQATYLKESWGKDYPRRSWLWPLVIGVVAFGIVFGFAVIVGMVQAILSQ